MEEDKCNKCIMNDSNKKDLIEACIHEIKKRPNTLQIIAFGISCLALGISLAKLLTA